MTPTVASKTTEDVTISMLTDRVVLLTNSMTQLSVHTENPHFQKCAILMYEVVKYLEAQDQNEVLMKINHKAKTVEVPLKEAA